MTELIIICAKYLFITIPMLLLYVFWTLSNARRKSLLLRGFVVCILAVTLAKGGGALYNEPRPFVVQHVAPLIPHGADNGFPSDHTLFCFACAFLLMPFSPRAIGPVLLLCVTVALARVASLLHSPLDIVASILMAAIANIIAYFAIREPSITSPSDAPITQ